MNDEPDLRYIPEVFPREGQIRFAAKAPGSNKFAVLWAGEYTKRILGLTQVLANIRVARYLALLLE
jgi:hypothetical protein